MPQMSPLFWLILASFFCLLVSATLIKMFFNPKVNEHFSSLENSNLNNFKHSDFNWKW